MTRATSPSFIAEFPLKTSAIDERALGVRLDAARQIYNAVLGECLRVLELMRESKVWQRARGQDKELKSELKRLKDKPLEDLRQRASEIALLFRAARARFDFKSSMADRFGIRLQERVLDQGPPLVERDAEGRPARVPGGGATRLRQARPAPIQALP